MSLLALIDSERELLYSGGRLGKLLRGRWPVIEQDYGLLKGAVLTFILRHRTGQAYVVHFSAVFREYSAEWSIALGLLWLELEGQSRWGQLHRYQRGNEVVNRSKLRSQSNR